MSGKHVVKARGLPWSATAKEIVGFFGDVSIVNGEEGVHIAFNHEGRASGEAFVEVSSKDDLEKALAHNNEHLGHRYIEVIEDKKQEMEWVVNRGGQGGGQSGGPCDGTVRLRGLPYGCSKQDIAEFFNGLEIIPYGISITMNQEGRPSGDAYVEFASGEEAEKALLKHKENMGNRYIEVFKSSKGDIKHVIGAFNDFGGGYNRPGPYDRPGPGRGGRGGRGAMGPSGFGNQGFAGGRGRGGRGGGMGGGMGGGRTTSEVQNSKTGHSVQMRGLPWEASLQDVLDFFKPVEPVDVRLLFEAGGRAKGQCDVDFRTHEDAEAAMLKDKENMGHRYIDLFLQSTPEGIPGWGGGAIRGGKRGGNYGGGYGGGNMGGDSGGGYNQGGYGNNGYMGGGGYGY